MTSIDRIVSNQILVLFMTMKFLGTKGKENLAILNDNKPYFNYNFVVEFNKSNSSTFSINEFNEVMDKLCRKGVYKRFFKFECVNCKTVTAIKERQDTEIRNIIFHTGHTCRFCMESSKLPNDETSTREVLFYCLNEFNIPENLFDKEEIVTQESAKEEELSKWMKIKKNILNNYYWLLVILSLTLLILLRLF